VRRRALYRCVNAAHGPPASRGTTVDPKDSVVADLAQVLTLMAVPATVLLVIRHLNRRGDRLYSEENAVGKRALRDTTGA
jgi:hypothetical protein